MASQGLNPFGEDRTLSSRVRTLAASLRPVRALAPKLKRPTTRETVFLWVFWIAFVTIAVVSIVAMVEGGGGGGEGGG